MDLMRLKKIVYNFLTLIKSKWYFNKPIKSEYIIYDSIAKDTIKKCFQNKKFFILSSRFEEFYLFFLFKNLFSLKFKNIYLNYHISLIKFINPKYIITFIDNNISFYNLKKYFPSIKFICIQNGNRLSLGNFGDNKKQVTDLIKKKFSVDTYFVQDNFSKSFLSRYIKSNYHVIGSFKNNMVKLQKANKNKDILYISQWRNTKSVFINGKYYPYKIWNKTEIDLLKKLINYSKERKIFLNIKLTSKDKNEIKFYNSLLKNSLKAFKYIKYSENLKKNYSILDKYNLVVTVDSTLGFESMMRGIKTVFYSTRYEDLKISKKITPNYIGNFLKNKNNKNGFYIDLPVSNEVFYEFMDANFKSSYNNWYKRNYKNINNFLFFDYGNKKLKKILNLK